MKKFIVLVLMLAACGGSTAEPDPEPTDAAPEATPAIATQWSCFVNYCPPDAGPG